MTELVWWYNPIVSSIVNQFKECDRRLTRFQNQPQSLEDFLEKRAINPIEKIVIGLKTSQLLNACNQIDNHRGAITLENVLNEMHPKFYSLACQLASFFEEHICDGRNFDFDTDIFDRQLESIDTENAKKFREKRGFTWKWKE